MRLSFEDRFWSHVDKTGECWIWTGSRDRKGYGYFHGNRKTLRAHRAAFEMSGQLVPPAQLVCHHCDNPSCVRLAHLFLGTFLDNAADAKLKGRYKPPVPPRGRVLTDAEVIEIRHRHLSMQESMRSLAVRFGVTHATISRRISGKPFPNRNKTHIRVATHLIGVTSPPQELGD